MRARLLLSLFAGAVAAQAQYFYTDTFGSYNAAADRKSVV